LVNVFSRHPGDAAFQAISPAAHHGRIEHEADAFCRAVNGLFAPMSAVELALAVFGKGTSDRTDYMGCLRHKGNLPVHHVIVR
jgi:hypothetical protein